MTGIFTKSLIVFAILRVYNSMELTTLPKHFYNVQHYDND